MIKRLGAYLSDTALSTRAPMFQPCLERPQIRFGLLKGAARGRRANLPNRFYRPCGEAVSHLPRPSSSSLEFRPFGRLKRGKVSVEARYKRRLSHYASGSARRRSLCGAARLMLPQTAVAISSPCLDGSQTRYANPSGLPGNCSMKTGICVWFLQPGD